MSPEDITLRETSQAQKGKSCQLSEARVKSSGVRAWEEDGQRGNGDFDVSGVLRWKEKSLGVSGG